jgi:hypothetical protein
MLPISATLKDFGHFLYQKKNQFSKQKCFFLPKGLSADQNIFKTVRDYAEFKGIFG